MTNATGTLLLDPDPRAASQARAFVAQAFADDAARSEVAQLLVSELVTNAVVHAASAVSVRVDVADGVATVSVRDADTGPLVMRRSRETELDEGGRGFLLIATLADAWGTEHHGGHKTVWFRLGVRDDREENSEHNVRRADEASPARSADRRLRTLLIRPVMQRALSFEQQLGELLARIMDALGAVGAAVVDSNGESLAVRGKTSEVASRSSDLILDDRRLGQLHVYVDRDIDDEDEAFIRVAAARIAVLAYEHGISHAERERVAGLDYLADATELLASSLSVSLCLTLVAQIVVPRMGDWCAIYAVDDYGEPRRLISNHRIEERIDAVNDLLESDRELRDAVVAAAAGQPATRLPTTVPVAGQRNSVAIAPLTSRGHTLGVVVVGRVDPLDAVGFMALLELGRRAALAVDNARLHEEQVLAATALQSSLLPSALPTVPGMEFAAQYHSASPGLSVGGDFYDAFVLPDGSVVCGIGDVCGKGAEAAAVTGMSRDLLRLLLQDGQGLANSLRRLNRALLENAVGSRFCTVALTQAVPNGEKTRVSVCLAGHPEPAVLRANGSTELVGVNGDLLGVIPDDLDLTEVSIDLLPGDALVLYTDGITERRDGARMFGQYGLRRALEGARGANAQELARHVEQAARSFVDVALRDDLAILVMRCTPASTV
jgi:sigma-B regulation protein RsbU (phosphoserine phosphatase)